MWCVEAKRAITDKSCLRIQAGDRVEGQQNQKQHSSKTWRSYEENQNKQQRIAYQRNVATSPICTSQFAQFQSRSLFKARISPKAHQICWFCKYEWDSNIWQCQRDTWQQIHAPTGVGWRQLPSLFCWGFSTRFFIRGTQTVASRNVSVVCS